MKLRIMILSLLVLFVAGCYVDMEEPVSTDDSELLSEIQGADDDQLLYETMSLDREDATEATTEQACTDPFADGTCFSQANCRRICGGGPGFFCMPATNCCYCE